MSRRAWIGVVLVIVVMAICLLLAWPKERTYHGRSLASWLTDLDDGEGNRGITWNPAPPAAPTEKQLKAREAIRAMGSPVLPELMRRLRTKESFVDAIKQRLENLWFRFGRRSPFPTVMRTTATETRHQAALGIIALEPITEPSLTELNLAFQDTEFSKDAGLVLASLGPRGLPPLLTAASNTPTSWQSLVAMWALGHFPSNADAALPMAAPGITNRDLGLKYASAFLLMRVQSQPEFAVTALTNGLSDSTINDYCLTALKSYGTQATSAVPCLLNQLNAPGRSREVGQTLKAIDPEAAAKA